MSQDSKKQFHPRENQRMQGNAVDQYDEQLARASALLHEKTLTEPEIRHVQKRISEITRAKQDAISQASKTKPSRDSMSGKKQEQHSRRTPGRSDQYDDHTHQTEQCLGVVADNVCYGDKPSTKHAEKMHDRKKLAAEKMPADKETFPEPSIPEEKEKSAKATKPGFGSFLKQQFKGLFDSTSHRKVAPQEDTQSFDSVSSVLSEGAEAEILIQYDKDGNKFCDI